VAENRFTQHSAVKFCPDILGNNELEYDNTPIKLVGPFFFLVVLRVALLKVTVVVVHSEPWSCVVVSPLFPIMGKRRITAWRDSGRRDVCTGAERALADDIASAMPWDVTRFVDPCTGTVSISKLTLKPAPLGPVGPTIPCIPWGPVGPVFEPTPLGPDKPWGP
jgi:hypothetical protein